MKKISTPQITIGSLILMFIILLATFQVANFFQNAFVERVVVFIGVVLIFVVGGIPGFVGLYRKEFTTVDLRRVISGNRAVRISWMWIIIWYVPLIIIIARVIRNAVLGLY